MLGILRINGVKAAPIYKRIVHQSFVDIKSTIKSNWKIGQPKRCFSSLNGIEDRFPTHLTLVQDERSSVDVFMASRSIKLKQKTDDTTVAIYSPTCSIFNLIEELYETASESDENIVVTPEHIESAVADGTIEAVANDQTTLSLFSKLEDLVKHPIGKAQLDGKLPNAFTLRVNSIENNQAFEIECAPPPVDETLRSVLTGKNVQRKYRVVQSRLEELEKEFEFLANRKQYLDDKVESTLRRYGHLTGIYLLSQFSFLLYATYSLSWDVMEPICYFIGLTVTTGGAYYYIKFGHDDEYKNVWNRLRLEKRAKLYKDDPLFSYTRYDSIQLDTILANSELEKLKDCIQYPKTQ